MSNKNTPVRHTFEVRRDGKPVNISEDAVVRNWLRASADFANYQMEGWDRCRQLTVSPDYYYRYVSKEHGPTRFWLERNGNCSLAHYEAAVDTFKAFVHLPEGCTLVEVENTKNPFE